MNRLKIALIVILNALCVSCQSKVDRIDVIGTFVANESAANDTIQIRDDGTYVHIYSMKPGGAKITTINTWSLDVKEGEPRITFNDFVWGAPFIQYGIDKVSENPGFWDVEVKKSFGSIKFCINEDLNRWYVKK